MTNTMWIYLFILYAKTMHVIIIVMVSRRRRRRRLLLTPKVFIRFCEI